MRLAVLDIGTNTVLLLIAEIENGTIEVLRDVHAIARLGEGVDRTHAISEEAYGRFLAVMRQHTSLIQSFNVDRIVAVGTSALRDALNREKIIQRAYEDTGIQIQILSGEEEARWSYMGALFGTSPKPSASQADGVCVIDIGGGSTEIAFGDGNQFSHGVSLDIGAVRLTERFFETIPISQGSETQARRLVRSELQRGFPNEFAIEQLIAVAGTPTTLAAMAQDLTRYNVAKVQNFILQRTTIDSLLELILRIPTQELIARFPVVNKSRADILPAGTIILQEAMNFLGMQQVHVSAYGLRYGIAIREASIRSM